MEDESSSELNFIEGRREKFSFLFCYERKSFDLEIISRGYCFELRETRHFSQFVDACIVFGGEGRRNYVNNFIIIPTVYLREQLARFLFDFESGIRY